MLCARSKATLFPRHRLFYVKKTVQFIETLYKGDIVVRYIKQQRSIFHHYKISNFTITHCQKNPSTDNV